MSRIARRVAGGIGALLLGASSFVAVTPSPAQAASAIGNAAAPVSQPAGSISVKGFDKKAMYLALEEAKKSATTKGSAVVWLPAGSYNIDWLDVSSNITIVAHRDAKILGHLTGGPIGAGGYDAFKNITIEGGTWGGATPDDNAFLYMRHGRNIKVSNATFLNATNHAINASASEGVTVTNCVFRNTVASPVDSKNSVYEAIHLDNATPIGEATIKPQDGTPAGKVKIEGNLFENVSAAFGNHHWVANEGGRKYAGGTTLEARNNVFRNVGGRPINIYSMDNVILERNKQEGTMSQEFVGIRDSKNVVLRDNGSISEVTVQDKSSVSILGSHALKKTTSKSEHVVTVYENSTLTIDGATIDGAKSRYGVAVNGASATIRNSTISGSSTAGVLVQNAAVPASLLVEKSTVKDTASDGIQVRNQAKMRILDSTVSNVGGKAAISFYKAGSGSEVRNTTVTNSAKWGIQVDGATRGTTIEGNRVTGSREYDIVVMHDSTNTTLKNNCVEKEPFVDAPSRSQSVVQNNTRNGCSAAKPPASPAQACTFGNGESFKDVTVEHPFCKDISWLATKGITTGWPDKTFRPQESVERGAFAAFLYRMAGKPAYTASAKSPFTDVPTTHPFYKEISWAADRGITRGYSDRTFRPSAKINRDAISAFLYRFAGEPKFTATKSFTDTATNEHRKAIDWMATTGISTGWADKTFRPTNQTERGAIAAFLHRYSDKGLPMKK